MIADCEEEGLIVHRIRHILLLCLLCWCPLAALPAAQAAISTHAQPHAKIAQTRRAASPSCSNDPTIGSKVWTVAISDTLAYLADNQALTILDVSNPARPFCRSHLALPPNSSVAAIEVSGAYAYVALYNFNNTDVALQIVDVHDPDNPSLLGSYQGAFAGDLAVVGNRVYLSVSLNLHIIDVSNPAAPALLGTYTLGSVGHVRVVGNRLYFTENAYGFGILDLTDPIHPVRLGGFYEGTITYYGFSVSGDRVYMIRPGNGIEVLDVSNPNNPIKIGTYTNIPDGNMGTFGIQVIGNTLYIAGAKFEIYDVSSPTAAVRIGSCDPPGLSINLRVVDNLAYSANPAGVGDYGLEIVDISNHTNPFLRGWFVNGNSGRFFYMPGIQR